MVTYGGRLSACYGLFLFKNSILFSIDIRLFFRLVSNMRFTKVIIFD